MQGYLRGKSDSGSCLVGVDGMMHEGEELLDEFLEWLVIAIGEDGLPKMGCGEVKVSRGDMGPVIDELIIGDWAASNGAF